MNLHPIASADPLTSAPATLEAFIEAFLRGTGRTPETYDESWPASLCPDPHSSPRSREGPERALG